MILPVWGWGGNWIFVYFDKYAEIEWPADLSADVAIRSDAIDGRWYLRERFEEKHPIGRRLKMLLHVAMDGIAICSSEVAKRLVYFRTRHFEGSLEQQPSDITYSWSKKSQRPFAESVDT